MVVQRVVEQKESLRTVAAAYGVSHETIRRLLHRHQRPGRLEV
jgi:IS30 family transposase